MHTTKKSTRVPKRAKNELKPDIKLLFLLSDSYYSFTVITSGGYTGNNFELGIKLVFF